MNMFYLVLDGNVCSQAINMIHSGFTFRHFKDAVESVMKGKGYPENKIYICIECDENLLNPILIDKEKQ